LAWATASFLAALAGAALTFRVGVYAPGGIAGRGWIALAAVYLGFRRVWGVALAALVFTLAERLGYGIQRFGALPPTALLGLPPALALVFYTISRTVNMTEIINRVKKKARINA
jgi:simple sugar transport system permease protein